MDGGAWWAAVRGVAKSRTQLSDFHFHIHGYKVYLNLHIPNYLVYIPRSRLARPYGNSMFNFLRNCQAVFSKKLYHFTSLPALPEDSSFSTFSPTPTLVCLFFNYSQSRFEVVSLWYPGWGRSPGEGNGNPLQYLA